ncbi:hypothetical protein ACWEP8_28470 [Streptomyces hydrogenans]
MSFPTVFAVEVPTISADGAHRGRHVFTGHADDARQAPAAARAAYHRARALLDSGQDVPRPPDGAWCARAIRPGWALEWDKAAARTWRRPLFPAEARH